MDLCGPLSDRDYRGNRFFIIITDDYSRKTVTYPLKYKSDAFDTFMRFQIRAERYLDLKIKFVRTDNGLELCGQEFENF
jgi:hypothetical protein